MTSATDQQLLGDYANSGADAAFTELVRRYVDFVYSAAFRMLHDSHQAEDVTQGVFLALAQNASRLSNRTVLAGWLHVTARNLAANVVRTELRQRNREKKAVLMNELSVTETDSVWEVIAPHLDVALQELKEREREALFLRYFQRKSAREVGLSLGVSEEAAQKRISRALERLRDFFMQRGVALGPVGLAMAISAKGVQAAPMGLAVTIPAVVLSGTVATLPALTTATKAIAMTTIQKILISATIATTCGTAIYLSQQSSTLRSELRTSRQQEMERTRQQQAESEQLAARLAALQNDNDRLKANSQELAKLRGELQQFRQAASAGDPSNETAETEAVTLGKDSWADLGFTSPQAALQTRGWAIVNGNRERFRESLHITDGARKIMEDTLVQMATASTDPDKDRYIQEIINNKLGVEEGILMPMMAENEAKKYSAYRMLSQRTPSPDEKLIEVETQMDSGPAKREVLKFHKFGNDWKVIIDEDTINEEVVQSAKK